VGKRVRAALAVEHAGKDDELAKRRSKFRQQQKDQDAAYKQKISDMNDRVNANSYSFQNCKSIL
jgi:hypothetical protein